MRKSVATVVALSSVISIGCSNSSGGGGSNPGSPAQSKEEAISRLTDAQKQAFAQWQNKVVKSCSPTEAFGLSDDESSSQGIDAAALIKSNGGSIVFQGADSSFAVVTSTHSFSGTGVSKSDQTLTVNGQTQNFSAEADRNGSNCEISLYGQKVFQTYIAHDVVIGAEWTPGKTATAQVINPPQIKALLSGVNEAVQPALFDLVATSLKPSLKGQLIVAGKLGLSNDQANQLFPVSSAATAPFALRLKNDSSKVWTNADSQSVIGASVTQQKMLSGQLSLEVRLAIGKMEIGDTKNTADNGTIKLVLDVQNAPAILTLQSSKSEGFLPYDKYEATLCLTDRASFLQQPRSNRTSISPSVDLLERACAPLAENISDFAYSSGAMNILLPVMLYGIRGGPAYDFGGWDDVALNLGLKAINNGDDLRSALDPSGQSPVLQVFAANISTVQTELVKTQNLAPLVSSIYGMALRWAFDGQAVDSAKIAQILSAVDNTAAVFAASSQALFSALAKEPNRHDDELSFAQNIDATYKQTAQQDLALAKDLSYDGFEREVFNLVIQRRTSLATLQTWSSQLGGIKSVASKYANLGPVKGQLVALSVQWIQSGRVPMASLDPLYAALDNSANPFDQSTRTLVNELAQDVATNQPALDFARGLSADYKQMAISVRDQSAAIGHADFGQSIFNSILQKQPSLDQLKAWNETLISAQAFVQRDLVRAQADYGSRAEWSRKTVIDRAIQEGWSNADFEGFEAIALVAAGKNTCEQLHATTALADCAGMDLFSRGKGKFFDPAFGGRYTALGRDFGSYMNQLGGFETTQTRWTLINAFFPGMGSPIWAKCDGATFNQKASTLRSQIGDYVATQDQMQKWNLERQLRDTLSDCQ